MMPGKGWYGPGIGPGYTRGKLDRENFLSCRHVLVILPLLFLTSPAPCLELCFFLNLGSAFVAWIPALVCLTELPILLVKSMGHLLTLASLGGSVLFAPQLADLSLFLQ